jgi:prophage regulatory protein
MEDRFIPRKEVLRISNLTTATLYREINRGAFPKQLAISRGRIGWRESEILKWLETRRSPNSTGNEHK